MAMYGQGKTRGQIAKLGINAATNQNSAAILLHEGHDPDFYFQFLSSQYNENREFGHSGGVSHLNAGLLKQIAVPVAPYAEQRRIAAILSTWDAAIAVAERLLQNSQSHLKALLEKTVLAPARQGVWPLQPIYTIADRVQRHAEDDEQLPILMISSGSGFVRQDEKYGPYMAGKSVENYIALKEGEFAYNKGNSKRYEFGCVFPLKVYERGLVPHVYVCFRLHEGLRAAFFEHLFAADYLHDQLGALVNTGVRNNGLLNIRPADFLGCKVPVPPLETQKRVASILDAGLALSARHEEVLQHLRNEKAALMAQLLTGKRRVRLPDTEATA